MVTENDSVCLNEYMFNFHGEIILWLQFLKNIFRNQVGATI